MRQPIRVAIIGTAKRSSYLYGPLLKALPEEVELVSKLEGGHSVRLPLDRAVQR